MVEKSTFSLISKYRNAFFGIAILFVMYSHNTMDLPGILHKANGGLQMLAQSGVDMFFLLSGMGCFISLEHRSVKEFYLRRAIRIFPSYILVLMIWGIISVGIMHQPIAQFWECYNLLSFFYDANLYEWFIAAIVATYILSPLFYKIVCSTKAFVGAIVFLYVYFLTNILGIIHFEYVFSVINSIWLIRIPTFMIGMFIGKCIVLNRKLRNSIKIFTLLLGIVAIPITMITFKLEMRSYWIIIRGLFLLISLSVFMVYIYMDQHISVVERYITPLLAKLSPITLEIYLVHEKILGVIKTITTHTVLGNIVSVCLAIIFAYYLNKIIKFLMKKLAVH